MSHVALLGAIEIGLLFGLVGIGVFLSFRVLNFPDLTVDGSFPLGAAVAGTIIVAGGNAYLATALAILAGALAGLVTAALNLRFRILHLLASILTMIALYSINLRIMGKPNLAILNEATVLTPFQGLGLSNLYLRPLYAGVVTLIVAFLLIRFLASDMGLAMRATGANPRMARAQGIDTSRMTYLGMALSNGLVALAGALFAQMNGFADVALGTGTIVVGLAAVIIGEAILGMRSIRLWVLGCVLGSVIYRIAVAAALNSSALGLNASDLNLVTAVLVAVALTLPGAKNPIRALLARKGSAGKSPS
ncbi:MAG TPA: ABC transporter permease [Hypericibacter adhaerens]|jgi:putative ABC transport system permease protein|uniref:ABC transporter permease n=1 Tax=Hypericibacter adhaerens TaxID=2602016 RepID=A0A5J6N185_9PROT|nr:ABC transporter permease [Hypericibacter adhaerens]QEX23599.1 ABC transporter permease [Hypericibacter adhaerens]HWA41665.1 ABC transporter permease [Hypericibacter adhaerens]